MSSVPRANPDLALASKLQPSKQMQTAQTTISSPTPRANQKTAKRERFRSPRRLASRTIRLHNCDVADFGDIAGDFGTEEYAYVVTPNVDHLIRFFDDESFRALYAGASFILNDSRLLARVMHMTRGVRLRVCTGSDLTHYLLSHVIRRDDNIVLVGASAVQAQQLAHRFGLSSLRHYEPPMGFAHDPQQLEECLRYIESQSPFRFCFLAVGCPQQELVANQLRERGKARGLALCIGASINFLTQVERRAPLWVQRLSLEWAFRLMLSPGRLARRYLIRGPRIFRLLPHFRFELLNPRGPRAILDASPSPEFNSH